MKIISIILLVLSLSISSYSQKFTSYNKSISGSEKVSDMATTNDGFLQYVMYVELQGASEKSTLKFKKSYVDKQPEMTWEELPVPCILSNSYVYASYFDLKFIKNKGLYFTVKDEKSLRVYLFKDNKWNLHVEDSYVTKIEAEQLYVGFMKDNIYLTYYNKKANKIALKYASIDEEEATFDDVYGFDKYEKGAVLKNAYSDNSGLFLLFENDKNKMKFIMVKFLPLDMEFKFVDKSESSLKNITKVHSLNPLATK